MSNYSKSTNFATKDNLTPGDPLKIVRGTEIDTEFNNIATAIATKTDNASAAIVGGTINDTTIGATTASTGAFTTLAASGNVTLSGGTANGVAYLNGSKVVTSGSALTFDGSSLLTSRTTDGLIFTARGTSNAQLLLSVNSGVLQYDSSNGSAVHAFLTNNAEQMRLTSTGLGIGTSSPNYSLTSYKGGAVANYLQVASGATGAGSGNGLLLGVDSSGNGVINAQGAVSLLTTVAGVLRTTLDSSGNLGIGTSSPSYKLDVAGAARSDSWIGRSNTSAPTTDAFIYRPADNTIALGTANTERARIDSSGNFLVGTTSFSYNPTQGATISGGSVGAIGIGHASGTVDGNGYLNFAYNGTNIGSVTQNSTTSVAYNTSSDYRLKNTIEPMTGALAKVALLKPVTYKWNADGSNGEGFIAHELAEVCPQAVTGEKDAVDAEGNPKYQGIDTSFLVATLTAAIQELKAEFDAYKASHP